MIGYRTIELRPDGIRKVGRANRSELAVNAAIASRTDVAVVGFPADQMAGFQMPDSLEYGLRPRTPAVEQIFVEDPQVDCTVCGQPKKWFDFGRECDCPRHRLRQVERLDPPPVACQDPFRGARIPDGEGEHSFQLGQDRLAFDTPAFEDDLGVRGRKKPRAPALKVVAQVTIVVDFAVEHDRARAIGVPHGLMAGRQVNDRKAAMSQADRTAELWGIDQFEAFVVRAAMRDRSGHRRQRLLPERSPETCYSAHRASSSPCALSPHGVPFCYRRQPSQRV